MRRESDDSGKGVGNVLIFELRINDRVMSEISDGG
jgi:hypothetical protein